MWKTGRRSGVCLSAARPCQNLLSKLWQCVSVCGRWQGNWATRAVRKKGGNGGENSVLWRRGWFTTTRCHQPLASWVFCDSSALIHWSWGALWLHTQCASVERTNVWTNRANKEPQLSNHARDMAHYVERATVYCSRAAWYKYLMVLL